MHRLSHLNIFNFRACRNVSLPLESYTPLVGQNNTGKSTILNAIRWVLKPFALSAGDFFQQNDSVVVSACIEGITKEILDSIPEQRHRKAIEPYCQNGRFWIRVSANGTTKKSIKEEVWDIKQCNPDDVPEHWREYPTGLPQAVSVLLPEPLYIEAMQDVGEDLGKAKAGTTIKGLLDEIMIPVLKAHSDLNTALDTIRNILSAEGENRSNHLRSFDQAATEALELFFPGLSLNLDLQTVDIKEFFKAGDLHVTDSTTGDRRRFDQLGTGAQRAIQMALIRYLAETRIADLNQPSRRMLLIDEPELYLHPQGVRHLRQALANLSHAGFQVIFATHSPLMLSRENAADTVIVNKDVAAGVKTQKPLRKAVEDALDNAQSQSRTLFELGNIADIYFSEMVVLCEGKTDRRLLPLAYERIFQKSPELDHITFVSLGSCNDIPKALPVLNAMGIKACAVADLDFAYTNARVACLLDKNGKDLNCAKAVLARLQIVNQFPLNGNGLPINSKRTGWTAADTWALLARDSEGQIIAQETHTDLKSQCIWVWPQGCIEQVTSVEDKGENAILEQEERLRSMSASDIELQMPEFKECFDWIRQF